MTVIPKEPAWRPGEQYREDQPDDCYEDPDMMALALKDLSKIEYPVVLSCHSGIKPRDLPAPESLKGKEDDRPVKSRKAVTATLPF